MCGRYAFDDIKDIYEARKILEEIASRLGEDAAQSVKTGEVFPSEAAAVVAQSSAQGYIADVMQWGYPMSSSKQLVINARSETVFSTNMFRYSVSQKKCLIPCTGFFEWKSIGKVKEKYIVRPKGQEFFYLAGLYDTFETGAEPKNRFVILTAPANTAMKAIHNRMPLMVHKQFAASWLKNELNSERIKQFYDMSDNLAIERV